MKIVNYFKLSALFVACCIFFGCTPEDITEKLGTIYGTVTDFSSGNPIDNVNVRLNPRGETTLTGSDGSFQFNDLPAGSYSLSLSKDDYVDMDDDYIIVVENGNSVHRDVQLKKGFESFKVTVNGSEVHTVYYGSTFLVTNNGTISIRVHGTADGGLYLHGPSGYFDYVDLQPNEGVPIYTTALAGGQYFNGGSVYLNSAQVSKTIVVIPRRNSFDYIDRSENASE